MMALYMLSGPTSLRGHVSVLGIGEMTVTALWTGFDSPSAHVRPPGRCLPTSDLEGTLQAATGLFRRPHGNTCDLLLQSH